MPLIPLLEHPRVVKVAAIINFSISSKIFQRKYISGGTYGSVQKTFLSLAFGLIYLGTLRCLSAVEWNLTREIVMLAVDLRDSVLNIYLKNCPLQKLPTCG